MSELAEQVKGECVRRLREGEGRIARCLGLLSHEQLWHRPNQHLSSAGNLVLHLCGNVGQWVNSTLGGCPDERVRDQEFELSGIAAGELLRELRSTLNKAESTIARLNPTDLERTWAVQGFQETGTGILMHVAEHFSYHVGQITLHTKLMLDMDTGYYAGQDLNVKG